MKGIENLKRRGSSVYTQYKSEDADLSQPPSVLQKAAAISVQPGNRENRLRRLPGSPKPRQTQLKSGLPGIHLVNPFRHHAPRETEDLKPPGSRPHKHKDLLKDPRTFCTILNTDEAKSQSQHSSARSRQ